MKRSRMLVTLGAGFAVMVVGSSTAVAADTCRTPTFTKTHPATSTTWDPGIEGQTPFTWSFRPTIRLVDGCNAGWIRVAPGVVTPTVRDGRRVETKVEILATKRSGWTTLMRVRTPIRPITYGLGRPGLRGPLKAGERITKVRVTTTLWATDAAGSQMEVTKATKTYVIPAAAKKKVTPKKTVKPPKPKKNPPGTIVLKPAPALPSVNGGGR